MRKFLSSDLQPCAQEATKTRKGSGLKWKAGFKERCKVLGEVPWPKDSRL